MIKNILILAVVTMALIGLVSGVAPAPTPTCTEVTKKIGDTVTMSAAGLAAGPSYSYIWVVSSDASGQNPVIVNKEDGDPAVDEFGKSTGETLTFVVPNNGLSQFYIQLYVTDTSLPGCTGISCTVINVQQPSPSCPEFHDLCRTSESTATYSWTGDIAAYKQKYTFKWTITQVNAQGADTGTAVELSNGWDPSGSGDSITINWGSNSATYPDGWYRIDAYAKLKKAPDNEAIHCFGVFRITSTPVFSINTH